MKKKEIAEAISKIANPHSKLAAAEALNEAFAAKQPEIHDRIGFMQACGVEAK